MLATAPRTHLLWWNMQFLSPLPPYVVVLFPFAAITVRHRVCVNFMGNMHTSRGACIHHVKRAYIMGNVHIWWQTRIHNGERAYMMADTHTSRWLCTHHGKYAYIMGNLYKSCQTRIHHGERAYIMTNTHTSRGTCILYGKHAYITGNVYTSLGKVNNKQMCVELNKAVLWIKRHICYTKCSEENRDSFNHNYDKIAFVCLIVHKYVSG